MRFHLSPTETAIMELSWERQCWLSGADFWNHFHQQGNMIKRQAVNTYLSRMTAKGLLLKNKTTYMYAYTREELKQKKASEVLNTMFHGSLADFVAAFAGTETLSPEEIQNVKNYLDSLL